MTQVIKKLLLSIAFIYLPISISAQEIEENIQEGDTEEEIYDPNALPRYLIFTHDACGNRTHRILRTRPYPISKSKKSLSPSVNSQPTGCDITINDWYAGCSGNVSIYNTAGQQVLSKPITNTTTPINLVAQPNGVYIIKIDLNGRITTKEYIKK